MKNEIKKLSLFFEKCKVKKKCFHSFSRSAKWKKCFYSFSRSKKVKSKCFEIQKWNFSRILNKSWETRFLNRFFGGWAEPKTKITGRFKNLLIKFLHPSNKKVQLVPFFHSIFKWDFFKSFQDYGLYQNILYYLIYNLWKYNREQK